MIVQPPTIEGTCLKATQEETTNFTVQLLIESDWLMFSCAPECSKQLPLWQCHKPSDLKWSSYQCMCKHTQQVGVCFPPLPPPKNIIFKMLSNTEWSPATMLLSSWDDGAHQEDPEETLLHYMQPYYKFKYVACHLPTHALCWSYMQSVTYWLREKINDVRIPSTRNRWL